MSNCSISAFKKLLHFFFALEVLNYLAWVGREQAPLGVRSISTQIGKNYFHHVVQICIRLPFGYHCSDMRLLMLSALLTYSQKPDEECEEYPENYKSNENGCSLKT